MNKEAKPPFIRGMFKTKARKDGWQMLLSYGRLNPLSARQWSNILEINFPKLKRWTREFLGVDPKAAMRAGYARELTLDEAFEVYLGGYLVFVLDFSISEARLILNDLKDYFGQHQVSEKWSFLSLFSEIVFFHGKEMIVNINQYLDPRLGSHYHSERIFHYGIKTIHERMEVEYGEGKQAFQEIYDVDYFPHDARDGQTITIESASKATLDGLNLEEHKVEIGRDLSVAWVLIGFNALFFDKYVAKMKTEIAKSVISRSG